MFKWLLQQLCPLFPFKDFLFTQSFLSALVLVLSLLPFPLSVFVVLLFWSLTV